MNVGMVAIDRVIPYQRNPRRLEGSVAKVAGSLREFGWRQPIVVDRDMVVVVGHARLAAARLLGMTEVPVHIAADLTANQARAYRIADNRTNEESDWHRSLLALELGDLADAGVELALTGFDGVELEELRLIGADGFGDPDDAPAVPASPVCRTGDLWTLGSHRLLCGDATRTEDVARLMAGEVADLCFTSPPYGQQRDYEASIANWDALMQGVFGLLPLRPEAQVLVNLGLIHRDNEWIPYWEGWIEWMRAQGWRRFGWYVWDQGPGLPGGWNGRLAPSHEWIFHFNRQATKVRKSKQTIWGGDKHAILGRHGLRDKDGTVSVFSHAGRAVQARKIPDSVIRVLRRLEELGHAMLDVPDDELTWLPESVVRVLRHKGHIGKGLKHPAPFPVALPAEIMLAFSEAGHLLYEPFCGSGSTIIAAQQHARRCYGMEIAPAYCDVIVQRWQNFSGGLATLEGGSSFVEIKAARAEAVAA